MSSRWILAYGLLGAGCASSVATTAPDRALFRLATSGVASASDADGVADVLTAGPAVAPAAVEDVPAPPAGPMISAYTASIRLMRGDGTTLTAPRLTTYAGQRANLQIANQTAFIQDFDVTSAPEGEAWVADPIVGMLTTGWRIELILSDATGRPGEGVIAFSVKGSDVRRPIATRTFDLLSPGPGHPVSIQLPRVESIEVTGARRVALGTEFEIARAPEPSGAGDLTVLATVVREMVPRPAEFADSDPAEESDPVAGAAYATLRALGTAAANGARAAVLRVTAIRLPAEAAGADAPGVERLTTLAVDSVIAPGATVSNRLAEAFVSDYEVEIMETTGHGACDPIVGTQDSGLTATVVGDSALRVAWRTTPRFKSVAEAPFAAKGFYASVTGRADPAFRFATDRPDTIAVERRIPLRVGRSVHPVFNLPDGGTAALVVEYEPGTESRK